jgi:eukaryotic-like serine/threonine-protein kinase
MSQWQEDVTETLAGIIKGEPDWNALNQKTPVALQRLLRKCLEKDRCRRLHDIADARIELEEAISNPTGLPAELQSGEAGHSASNHSLSPAKVVALVVLTALVAIAATLFLNPINVASTPQTPSPKQSELILKNGARLFQKFAHPFALSPDGKRLAYIIVDDKVVTDRRLHIRNLETGIDHPVLGTGGIVAPFFSPTGDRLGFVSGHSLVTQRLDGGDRRTVVPDGLPLWNFNSADWSADGHIVYTGRTRELMIVDQNGVMPPRALTEAGEHEVHRNPRFLDDGKLVVFSVLNSESGESIHVEVVNTQFGERKSLDIGAFTEVRYVKDGFLLCSKGSEVHAVPFDLQTLKPRGQRKPVLSGIRSKGTTLYDIAKDGTLVYQPGHDSRGA